MYVNLHIYSIHHVLTLGIFYTLIQATVPIVFACTYVPATILRYMTILYNRETIAVLVVQLPGMDDSQAFLCVWIEEIDGCTCEVRANTKPCQWPLVCWVKKIDVNNVNHTLCAGVDFPLLNPLLFMEGVSFSFTPLFNNLNCQVFI